MSRNQKILLERNLVTTSFFQANTTSSCNANSSKEQLYNAMLLGVSSPGHSLEHSIECAVFTSEHCDHVMSSAMRWSLAAMARETSRRDEAHFSDHLIGQMQASNLIDLGRDSSRGRYLDDSLPMTNR